MKPLLAAALCSLLTGCSLPASGEDPSPDSILSGDPVAPGAGPRLTWLVVEHWMGGSAWALWEETLFEMQWRDSRRGINHTGTLQPPWDGWANALINQFLAGDASYEVLHTQMVPLSRAEGEAVREATGDSCASYAWIVNEHRSCAAREVVDAYAGVLTNAVNRLHEVTFIASPATPAAGCLGYVHFHSGGGMGPYFGGTEGRVEADGTITAAHYSGSFLLGVRFQPGTAINTSLPNALSLLRTSAAASLDVSEFLHGQLSEAAYARLCGVLREHLPVAGHASPPTCADMPRRIIEATVDAQEHTASRQCSAENDPFDTMWANLLESAETVRPR